MARRTTLYIHDESLLDWVKQYTGTTNVSEAVERALKELKALYLKRRREALAALCGIWVDAPEVEQAMKELDEGWKQWKPRNAF